MAKEIVIVSGNKGKIKEVQEIFNEYKIIPMSEIGINIEVEEDQNTFEGNAKKKAKEISEKVNMPCIADDSGLCIDKYDGWPGVHTARFLGENSTSKQRNEYILEKMKNLEGNERKARVECCVVYYDNEGKEVHDNGDINIEC